jgi:hypothetical protein
MKMHIEQFPQDVQDFIYDLCVKAMERAKQAAVETSEEVQAGS